MKMIRFLKLVPPHQAGDTRVVPDEIADRLIASGEAEFKPSIFDTLPPTAPPPEKRRNRRRAAQ